MRLELVDSSGFSDRASVSVTSVRYVTRCELLLINDIVTIIQLFNAKKIALIRHS